MRFGGRTYLWSRHLEDAHSREPDTVAVAERFLETPYLWGGRTSEGIDCSGLVQTALTAAGVASPRDSDMMEAALGKPIAIDDKETRLKRGDLVFWNGHVGIMRDSVTLLHANGWRMKTISEPLTQARERIAANGGEAHHERSPTGGAFAPSPRLRGEGWGEGRGRLASQFELAQPLIRPSATFSPRGEKGTPYFLPPMPRPRKAAVEARQSAAAIDELLRSAGPSGMRVGIDVQLQRRALFAIGRAGHELDAVGHDDLDHVVVGMNVRFHRHGPGETKSRPGDVFAL